MKASFFARLALSATLLASLACSGDKAASAPDGAASGTEAAKAAAAKAAAPADPTGVVAAVNGKQITSGELDTAIKLYSQSQGIPMNLPQDRAEQVRKIVMDGLIDRELLYQKSVSDGIKPDQTEVDSIIKDARSAYPDDAEWEQHLHEQGVSDTAEFTNIVERSLVIEAVVKKVTDIDKPTDADVHKYYDEHPEEMQMPEKVRASHILFRVPEGSSEADKTAAKAKADKTLAELKGGADFAAIAKERSEDPGSGKNGGDLGFFAKGRMVPEFEKVAFSLKVGEISDVFESPFGYHIMKVTGKEEGQQASFEEVKENLRNFLHQKQARDGLQSYLANLRTEAKIETF